MRDTCKRISASFQRVLTNVRVEFSYTRACVMHVPISKALVLPPPPLRVRLAQLTTISPPCFHSYFRSSLRPPRRTAFSRCLLALYARRDVIFRNNTRAHLQEQTRSHANAHGVMRRQKNARKHCCLARRSCQ